MQTLILSWETMRRLYQSSSKATIIWQNINRAKNREPQRGKLNNILAFFSDLRDYNLKNMGINPPITSNTIIQHNDATLLRLDKARRELKSLNIMLEPDKRKNNYIYCRDTLDIFEGHIRQMINRGAGEKL